MKSIYLQQSNFAILAHRGGRSRAVPNTLEAFRQLVAQGFGYIETDVRSTRDGIPVLIHDHMVCVGDRRMGVEQLSLHELEEVAVVTTLEKALRYLPEAKFSIDLKDEGSARSVPDVIERTGSWPRVCITSFSDKRINQARGSLPQDICLGLGVRRGIIFVIYAAFGIRSLPRLLRESTIIQPPWTALTLPVLGRRIIKYSHLHNIAVHAWTINTKNSIAKAILYEVDGIVTDYPALARSVYEEIRTRTNVDCAD